MQLFDTHTHFDVADFDHDRQHLAEQAKQVGVDALVLIGFVESRFDELIHTHQQLQYWENVPLLSGTWLASILYRTTSARTFTAT
jgi:TatD DNase family protein